MNELGYDLATIGNHEWDNGPETLGRYWPQLKFPVVCANIDFTKNPELGKLVKPYHIFEDIGVAVIGYITNVGHRLLDNLSRTALYSCTLLSPFANSVFKKKNTTLFSRQREISRMLDPQSHSQTRSRLFKSMSTSSKARALSVSWPCHTMATARIWNWQRRPMEWISSLEAIAIRIWVTPATRCLKDLIQLSSKTQRARTHLLSRQSSFSNQPITRLCPADEGTTNLKCRGPFLFFFLFLFRHSAGADTLVTWMWYSIQRARLLLGLVNPFWSRTPFLRILVF